MLREQEIGEGGGEEQPGGDASELKTQSSRQTDRRKKERTARASRRCMHPAARRSSTCLTAVPRCRSLPISHERSSQLGPRGARPVWKRGPAGPAKGWRESLMSCAAH